MKNSIITINFNNKAGLQKTIDSVITQTFKDYEWIIIDGGSTDGSKELIEKYANHITYWVSEPDKGIYNAMNKGILQAKGEYFLFLNSGDCLYDIFTLERFNQRENTEDVIYGNAIVVDSTGNEVSKWHNPENLKLSYFWGHGLNHQATFMKKRCFEKFMYNENNKIVSDTELFMLLLYNSYSFAKYDSYVAKFDNTGISFTTKYNEYDGMVNRILPQGVKEDYDEIIAFRDVDLAIMIRNIISSNRFVRNLTRVFLYPIHYLLAKK